MKAIGARIFVQEWKNYNCGERQMKKLPVSCYSVNLQRQPSIGVLQKKYSAKTQQLYWRLPMKKCDFNRVA